MRKQGGKMLNKQKICLSRKKIMIFLLILLFTVAMSYAASIIVNSPHSGLTWYKGKTYTITWTKSGSMDSKVKIRLYQGNTKVFGITDNTDNDGSFEWTVPTTLKNGAYRIRVKTIDNGVFDDSGNFTISTPPIISSSINIISPATGASWVVGQKYHIKWTVNGSMNSYVKIRLYKDNIKVLGITNKTSNKGDYEWVIPTSLPKGSYYIRVKTINNKVFKGTA